MAIFRQLPSWNHGLPSRILQLRGLNATIRGVELHADSPGKSERKAFWSFSKADAGWFLFWYVFCFAVLRFDLLAKHHPWFQHPIPTLKACWLALLSALALWLLTKLKFAAR